MKNETIIDSDSIIIGTLVLPNLDPNSVPYIDINNTVQDKVLSNGQLLIGSTGNPPTANSLTGTANEIIVTNGPHYQHLSPLLRHQILPSMI